MLIKLRNDFYQVECDAFINLATDLLDIRPKSRRAKTPARKNTLIQRAVQCGKHASAGERGLISPHAVAILKKARCE
ncbi:hypothetical protein C7G83_08920 [Siccibacter turicensis]|uniref:Uncharacterized protein n=1 Tax=Siccibacter turicensis TaxID=357233 RepID=A0A2P8VL49_9ENTR|nr:hypothetical protein C7G83_08920 [Siccibacter turicensis]